MSGTARDQVTGDRRAPRVTLLPAAVALVLILGAGVFAEDQMRGLARMTLREAVRDQADVVRTRIDRALEDQLRALDALESALAAADSPGRAAFDAPAEPGRAGDPPLLRATATRSRSGDVRVHPPGDGAAPALAALVAERAGAASGARSLMGPGAPAVLIWTGGAGTRTAAALDLRALYDIASAPGDGAPIDVALTAGDANGRELLLGAASVLADDPVTVDLAFPAANWRLAAAPQAGWAVEPGGVWTIRLITLLSAGLIVGPMMRTRRLVAERARHIADLNDRETELVRLSRRLGLALDASRVGVWDYDIDSDTLVWDDRMDELYGLPRDGRARSYADWRGALHPEDIARAEAEFRTAVNRTGRYDSDYRLLLPGGGVRNIRAIGAVYANRGGAARIVGVNWDVTAEVQRRAELDAKRREAEAASVAKSQFLATMSHEIRTPMNGVLGMLDLLLRSGLDPEQRGRAEIAHDSASHLLALLNDILDFSRLEAQGVALETGPMNVERLVRGVVALLCAAAEERGVALRAHVDPATPAWLTGDATRLRQVVLNLVGNAVKFTDAGRVDVRVGFSPDATGGLLEVAVRDTGIGIPAADRARLFQRFVQVDSSTTRQRGGAGLGLAISRQLVELMGGEIGVDSAPGQGSTFRFWIPAAPCPAPEIGPVAGPAAADPAQTPPMRILLAEDSATNQHILCAYLTLAGHSVHVADNGAKALAALAREPFDLVLMDIQMPEMDGMTAARRIRALPGPAGAVPIIALTANAMQGDRERYIATGMTDYVSKPVSAEALNHAVARVVGYSASSSRSTGTQPAPGSKLSIAPATSRVASPRSAS